MQLCMFFFFLFLREPLTPLEKRETDYHCLKSPRTLASGTKIEEVLARNPTFFCCIYKQ